MQGVSRTQGGVNPCLAQRLILPAFSLVFACCVLFFYACRDAVDALSSEIRSLLTGPLKGKRTGVGELRKKVEAQSDAQVSLDRTAPLRFAHLSCTLLYHTCCESLLRLRRGWCMSSSFFAIVASTAAAAAVQKLSVQAQAGRGRGRRLPFSDLLGSGLRISARGWCFLPWQSVT